MGFLTLYSLIRKAILIIVTSCLILPAYGCRADRVDRTEGKRPDSEKILNVSVLHARIDMHGTPSAYQVPSGHKQEGAVTGAPTDIQVIFSRYGHGVVYSYQRDGKTYVVHNNKPPQVYEGIQNLVISPDGQHVAMSASFGGKWRMVTDGVEGEAYNDLGEPSFSPNSRHVAYEAMKKDKWFIVLDGREHAGAASYYDIPRFTGNSEKILTVEIPTSPDHLEYAARDLDFTDKKARSVRSSLFVINKGLNRIAANEEVGKKVRLIEFDLDEPRLGLNGPVYDEIGSIAFGPDDKSLAYVAVKKGKRYVVWNGKEELLPEGDLRSNPVIRPDNKGVGILIANNERYYLHQAFFRDNTPRQEYDEAGELVYSPDGSRHAYAARRGNIWFIVVNGKEGAEFDRVVTPLFSPDSKRLIYRARQNDKRFVVVADIDGNIIREHPKYDMVFDTLFAGEGRMVAYGVKDGRELWWKVERLDK